MIANTVLRKAVAVPHAAVRAATGVLRTATGLLHTSSGSAPARDRGDADPPSEAAPAAPAPATSGDPIDAEREVLAEAIRAEQADVGELADPNLDVADVQAELRAKHLLEERREQEERNKQR